MSRHSTIYVLALCLILLGGSLQSAQNTSSQGGDQGGNQGGNNAPKGRPFTLPDLADTPKTPPKPPATAPPAAPPATPPATSAPGTVAPAPVTASPVRQGSFADAAYLTQKGFLAAVKDVSVAIHAPRATTQYVPESELQADVVAALSDYGIAVRPNGSVRLDVTVVQRDTRFIWNDDDSDTQDMHDILVVLSFQTTGVARRGTKLYPIVASPAQSEMVGTVTQNNSTRRLFFGDETRADMQKQLASLISGTLKTISENDNVDTTPWYAAKWTEAQKAAANTEFATLMKGTTVAADHFAGLDVLPTVTSNTSNDGSGCRLPARYSEEWRRAFADIGWTKTSAETPLLLEHGLQCTYVDTYNTPKYTRIWNSVDLREPNFVFVLNGRVFRKPGLIQSWNVLMTADGADDMVDDIDELFDQVSTSVQPLRNPARTTAARP